MTTPVPGTALLLEKTISNSLPVQCGEHSLPYRAKEDRDKEHKSAL